MSGALKIEDGQVVSMDYTLRVDGDIVDTSDGHGPLEFIQGIGNIIPGLERELYGMVIGDSKSVSVEAVDAYGELDPDAYADVPRSEFPTEIPIEKDVEIQVRDEADNPMFARIDTFDDQTVKLNFNHPLAGKTLNFDVTIVGLRGATPEELEHGHAHTDGGHHH